MYWKLIGCIRGVDPRGTGPNLGICRNFFQTRRRARPSVGRGGAERTDRVRDLELRERQVSKQTACQSVLPLALRTGRTVDADGERRSSNWKVDGDQLFTDGDGKAASAYGLARSLALVSSSEPPCYLPTVTTNTCARHGAFSCCSSANLVARVPQDCC